MSAEDQIESAYRFLLADLMPFGRNARIQLEHGGVERLDRALRDGHLLVRPAGACLVQTRRAARRRCGERARARVRLARRVGAVHDHVALRVGRRSRAGQGDLSRPRPTAGARPDGSSEFTLKIDPANRGVLLRRKLDYAFPNQRAEVDGGWREPAGVWYPGGVEHLRVSPTRPESWAPTQHVVQTSNRRFRDDEFLLPLALTKGRSEIRVRVKFTPVQTPLYPGYPLPELAWSELRYTAYSYVEPK